MVKPIYYSKKNCKYYFNNTTAFGSHYAQTVYGCHTLLPGMVEIKEDRHGRKFFMAEITKISGRNGAYYKLVRPITSREEEIDDGDLEFEDEEN